MVVLFGEEGLDPLSKHERPAEAHGYDAEHGGFLVSRTPPFGVSHARRSKVRVVQHPGHGFFEFCLLMGVLTRPSWLRVDMRFILDTCWTIPMFMSFVRLQFPVRKWYSMLFVRRAGWM